MEGHAKGRSTRSTHSSPTKEATISSGPPQLNIIEKHRLLLTVGSQAARMNLGQLMSGHFSRTFPAEAIAAFESMNVFLNPANTGFPLKAGFELYIGATGEKENLKKQFRFDVGLSEPGIVDGKPLLETVN